MAFSLLGRRRGALIGRSRVPCAYMPFLRALAISSLRVDALALGVLLDQVRVGREQHRQRVPGLLGDPQRLAALGEQQRREAVPQVIRARRRVQAGGAAGGRPAVARATSARRSCPRARRRRRAAMSVRVGRPAGREPVLAQVLGEGWSSRTVRRCPVFVALIEPSGLAARWTRIVFSCTSSKRSARSSPGRRPA